MDTDIAYKDYPAVIKGAKLNGFSAADQKPSVPTQPEELAPQPVTSFKKGDLVKITGTKYYSGKTIPAWVKAKNWCVKQVNGARVVIDRSEDGRNAICSPVNATDLQLVTAKPGKTVDELAYEVIRGLWGNGAERRNSLTAAGYDYEAVQRRVNNGTVTFHFRDGHTESREYHDRKHSKPWTPEQQEKAVAAIRARWTDERRQKMSETVKKIRSEKKWRSR